MRARTAPPGRAHSCAQFEPVSPVGMDASVGVAAAPFAVCLGSSERAGALAVGLAAAGFCAPPVGTTLVAGAAAALAVCAGSAERGGAFAVGLVAAGLAPAGLGLPGAAGVLAGR